MSGRTKRIEAAIAREAHQRKFYGFTHRYPDRETTDAILQAQLEMSLLLDRLCPDKSEEV